MLKVLIVDDEEDARITLHASLEAFCPDTEVIGEADSVKGGIEAIKNLGPDLVLLDVRLSPGSGFDILDAFEEIDFEVIFVTAYDQYAIKAIRFSALDYLLKPVAGDELMAAVERAVAHRGKSNINSQFAVFKEAINAQYGRIVLPTQEGFVVIELKDIMRCEADRNYTHFFLEGNKKLTISRTLKVYEELLSDNGFFRIHQSHLVNLAQVKEYKRRKKGGIVLLLSGEELPVSEGKKEAFMKQFLIK